MWTALTSLDVGPMYIFLHASARPRALAYTPVRLLVVLDERHINVVTELALQYFFQRIEVLLEPSSCPNQVGRSRCRGGSEPISDVDCASGWCEWRRWAAAHSSDARSMCDTCSLVAWSMVQPTYHRSTGPALCRASSSSWAGAVAAASWEAPPAPRPRDNSYAKGTIGVREGR